jgi:cysteine desulfurase
MNRVYFDHAATTRTDARVVEAMLPYLTEVYGNPSSVHDFGQEARAAVEIARKKVADFIGARPEEIVYTSSGTESCNFAIKGLAAAPRRRAITLCSRSTPRAPFPEAEKQGFRVTQVPVDKHGLVDPAEVARQSARHRDDFGHARNTKSDIQPIEEISKIAKEANRFHTGGSRVDIQWT